MMIRQWLTNIHTRFEYWALRKRLRVERSKIDLLEHHLGDDLRLLWPISDRAKEVMENLSIEDEAGEKSLPPRMWGGYVLPSYIREELHHNYLPLIACHSADFGLLIDTP